MARGADSPRAGRRRLRQSRRRRQAPARSRRELRPGLVGEEPHPSRAGVRTAPRPRAAPPGRGEVGRIWKVRDEAEVRARVQALNAEIARANARAAEGPPTRLGAPDVGAIVAEWRSRAVSSRASRTGGSRRIRAPAPPWQSAPG